MLNQFSSLNNVKLQAKHDDPEAIATVAAQFESLFLETILSTARNSNIAINDDSEMNSDQIQFATNMLDRQMAQTLSSRGLGIAKMLTQQLTKAEHASAAYLANEG